MARATVLKLSPGAAAELERCADAAGMSQTGFVQDWLIRGEAVINQAIDLLMSDNGFADGMGLLAHLVGRDESALVAWCSAKSIPAEFARTPAQPGRTDRQWGKSVLAMRREPRSLWPMQS